jgi:hypothetical protein
MPKSSAGAIASGAEETFLSAVAREIWLELNRADKEHKNNELRPTKGQMETDERIGKGALGEIDG